MSVEGHRTFRSGTDGGQFSTAVRTAGGGNAIFIALAVESTL